MIAAFLAGNAWGTDRVVTSTSDTPGLYYTLREALTDAQPGDRILFGGTAFATYGTITISTPLPVLDAAGVILDGDHRAMIACAAAMTVGNGLTSTADDVEIHDLDVSGCPDHGIEISGHEVVVEGAGVTGNDKFGLLVNGTASTTSDVVLDGNELSGNCANATSTCAGIGVRRGTGGGIGPHAIVVVDNAIDAHTHGGHGIALLGGRDHVVSENLVGLGGGNAGNGILVAAASGLVVSAASVDHNVVVDNTLAGIQIGTRAEPSIVEANLVGTDGTLLAGNGGAGIQIFASDLHEVRGNTVVDNGGGGILVEGLLSGDPAQEVTIAENLVGVMPDGSPAGNTGVGIRLEASTAAGIAVEHVVTDNVVGANTGAGIRVEGRTCLLRGNAVGLDADRATARGNGAEGIRVGIRGHFSTVTGDGGGAWAPNVVGDNVGTGILVEASSVAVVHNIVGWDASRGADRGNGSHGIAVAAGQNVTLTDNFVGWSTTHGIALTGNSANVGTVVIDRNDVRENGGRGVSVQGTAVDHVRLVENTIADNGQCAIWTAANVNGASGSARPVVTDQWPTGAKGTYTDVGGSAPSTIEVYHDAGGELATRIGVATLQPATHTWSIALGDVEIPIAPDDRVVAIATWSATGRSSTLASWCLDGCPGEATGSCNDGSPCTSDTCGAGGCSHGVAGNGSACQGGSSCLLGAATCAGGACVYSGGNYAAEGTVCNDGDACSKDSECDGLGHCEAVGKPRDCNDGDPCTEEQEDSLPVRDPEPNYDLKLLMHEEGHNLWLTHTGRCGGDPDDEYDPIEEDCDNGVNDDSDGLVDCEDVDCMPDASCGICDRRNDDDNGEVNFVSVMNYRWAGGLTDARNDEPAWDYSGGFLETIDEDVGFDEHDAMYTGTAQIEDLYYTEWQCADADRTASAPPHRALPLGQSLTWPSRLLDLDCDSVFGDAGLTHDLGGEVSGFRVGPVHTDTDEWAHIQLDFQRNLGTYSRQGRAEGGTEEEPTAAELAAAGMLFRDAHPRATMLPGCETITIPRTNAARRVPVVVFGSAIYDPTDAVGVLQAAAPVKTVTGQDLDQDGFDDLWVEFRAIDLGLVAPSATLTWSSRKPSSKDGYASWAITTTNSALDTDADGIHDACDDCPTVGGTNRLPNGCPP